MRLLTCDDDIAEGLIALTRADPRLKPMLEVAGEVPLRHRPPGFEGMARIIVAQMLSVASANAIWNRVETLLGTATAARFLAVEEADLKAAGLSRGKIRTIRAVAEAELAGLDFTDLATQPPAEAVNALTALPGIGLWSAEIFLLFCARQADAFPAGDLALQIAATEGLRLNERPSEKALRQIAEPWAPWRGVAAKLLWAYYKACREGRAVLPA